MTTRRDILLDALDRWTAEGTLDTAARDRLAARLPASADAPLDEPLRPARAGAARGFGPAALRFVGGLLLGAAAIALVQLLDLSDLPGAWTLLGLGAGATGVGLLLQRREGRDGLAEAAYAAGMVAAGVAAVLGKDAAALPWLAAALGALVLAARRGRGPSVVLGAAAFALGTFVASGLPDVDPRGQVLRVLLWMGALVAASGALLAWRRETWTTVTLGLLVAPLAMSFLMLLLALEVEDSVTIELGLGGFLAGLLALGAWLGNRGLTTGAAAGLTIDAVVFAFDVGGPGTALALLLALGGLLVWQAEPLRRWMRGARRSAA